MAENRHDPLGTLNNPKKITVSTLDDLWAFLLEKSLQNRGRITGAYSSTLDTSCITIAISQDSGTYHYVLFHPHCPTLDGFVARLEEQGVFREHALLPERVIELYEEQQLNAKTQTRSTLLQWGLEITKIFIAAALASVVPYFCAPKQAEITLLRTDIENSASVATENQSEIARLRQDIKALQKPITAPATTRRTP